MANIFSEIEEEIFFNENLAFDEEKIKKYILEFLGNKINEKEQSQKGFYFEEIIYNFFEYMNIPLTKSLKTRDFGIDGIVKFDIGFLGEIDLGLQIKYKLIDSTDVDLFLSALKNAELQLGVIVCKDSRNLVKYELNSKLKAILFSKGIKIKEKLINENVNLNPVFILKFEEVAEFVASQIRAFVKSVYKK
jgi:hypothetical protein